MGTMSQRIELRCTDKEKAELQAEADAAGLKLSALIRQRTLGAVSGNPAVDSGAGSGPRQVTETRPHSASPRAPAKTTRGCPNCGRGIGSPTMRYCGCGGKIEPPPGRIT